MAGARGDQQAVPGFRVSGQGRPNGPELLRWHQRALLTHRALLAPAAGVSLPSPTAVPLTVDLRAKLKAYLEAAPDTARYDALMHGIKQISLPGDEPAVVDASVAETSPGGTA